MTETGSSPFAEVQLSELYAAIRDALRNIHGFEFKTREQRRGEIFTTLRRKLGTESDHASMWRQLFNGTSHRRGGKLKYVYWFQRDKWDFIEKMVHQMEEEYVDTNDPNTGLERLRLILAGMNSAIDEIKRVNAQGERVLSEVDTIDKFLHGDVEATAQIMR